jgi:uncharacterized membrane protein YbhN (UPF0104 family)
MPARPPRWRQKSAALASAGEAANKHGVPAPPSGRRARTFLRYGLSLAVLGWIGWQVEWRTFGDLRSIDGWTAAPAVLIAGLAYPLQAWRWQLLLATQGIHPRSGWVHAVFWVGNFYNAFLPGGIAGDGVRLHFTWRAFPGRRAGAAASIVADRLLGFAALLGLAVGALALQLGTQGGHAGLRALLAASAAAFVALLALALLLARPRLWTPVLGRWLGADRSASIGTAFTSVAGRRSALTGVIGLSVAVWLLDFVALWLLARSVGLEAGILEMTVAAAAAYAAASLPISIGGHGVREGTLVIVLGWLGVGASQPGLVLSLAVAFWAVTTGWSLFGGLATFILPAVAKNESATPPRDA